MNDKAREALVAAALKGVRQVKGVLWDGDGRCALGVLCDASARSRTFDVFEWADLRGDESRQIAHANDVLGWDFLMIARKIGVPDGEVQAPEASV